MIRIAAVPQDAAAIVDATLDTHRDWPETLPVIVDGEARIRVYARTLGGNGWTVFARVEPGVIGTDGIWYGADTADDHTFWPSWKGRARDGRMRANWNARRVMHPFLAVSVPVEWVTLLERGGADDAGVIRDEYGPDHRPLRRRPAGRTASA